MGANTDIPRPSRSKRKQRGCANIGDVLKGFRSIVTGHEVFRTHNKP
jgi:hypothetical protein